MRPIAPRLGAGVEEFSVAEDQHEYLTITMAAVGYSDGTLGMIGRWTLSDDERARVAAGEDIYVTFPQRAFPHSLSLRPSWADPE